MKERRPSYEETLEDRDVLDFYQFCKNGYFRDVAKNVIDTYCSELEGPEREEAIRRHEKYLALSATIMYERASREIDEERKLAEESSSPLGAVDNE
jgi:hypothetical protein